MKRDNLLIVSLIVFCFFVIWLLLPNDDQGAISVAGDEAIPEVINFNFHVKPILSDNCFACHGPDAKERKAGLRLDIESDAKAELPENPGKFAVLAGEISQSELIDRIHTEDESIVMPPPETHLELTGREKLILEKWIEQGAVYEKHWSYLPPEKSALPEVDDEEWVRNDIDQYVLHAMESAGLTPEPETSASKLLRRMSIDLTGLPPTKDEMDRFIEDQQMADYEGAINYYMSKPAYGEQMAREWLDVARYADSHGYQDDSYRTMWPWRDWVIHAFNENYSYDKFLTLQLAGDLMPDATKEHMLATGFNRNHPITQEGGVIDEEYRSTYVTDRTNTLGKGIMGLTLECAKCHDHKYDALSQKEYFSMYSFFNYVDEKGLQMDAVQAKNRKYYADAPFISVEDEDLEGILSFVNKKDSLPLNVMVMNDSAVKKTYVLSRGNYDQPTDEVGPTTPAAVLPFSEEYPRNRLGLAQWLVDEDNPLTARVYVNRLWAKLFGRGITTTTEDFGNQGALPTHPELLDWLAVEFVENDWDIKYLLKQMMLSATYRQSSVIRPEKKALDPENVYFARGPRFRLSAEEIRDYILTTSGLLNDEVGGPSVKPYQPPGLWEETNAGNNRGILTSYQPDSGQALYRRSLYTFWKRTLPPPTMTIFDAPNRDLCEVRRQKTNTPLQALALQNDEQVLEAARVLASNVSNEVDNEEEAIKYLFNSILIRDPSEEELDLMLDYQQSSKQKFSAGEEEAEQLLSVGQYEQTAEDPEDAAALMMVAQVLYNLDETITKE
ncbi:MAG: PSD1 and planctomycete cytochrome C domain-containing protein [Bacteroidota bacterium]